MPNDWRTALDATLESIEADLRRIRRHLHSHPEPSLEEHETTRFLADALRDAGIPCTMAPTGRGLWAGPQADAPLIALRADIDALQLHDLKDVSYKSTRDGVMHACGHDAHAAMALGAALALWRIREWLPCPVAWRAIFQPAEEVGLGAREMIRAGAMDGVGAIVALHVDPEQPVGRVAQRPGVMTAFCSDLLVTIRGQGGHTARPHLARDPIAAAVQFVAAVYQQIPRSIDSREAAVLSFGRIHGGASPNVIPESVELQGTLRTLNRDATLHAEARLRQIAAGMALAFGVEIDLTLNRIVDAVVNDPEVTAVCALAAAEVVGPDQVVPIPLPSMGGEDFAAYLAHAPGCLLRLGVAADGTPRHPLHSPYFDIDERALAIGARTLARSVVHLSQRGLRP